jgi:hypothetical protein
LAELTGDWQWQLVIGGTVATHLLAELCHQSGRFQAIRFPSSLQNSEANLIIWTDRLTHPAFVQVNEPVWQACTENTVMMTRRSKDTHPEQKENVYIANFRMALPILTIALVLTSQLFAACAATGASSEKQYTAHLQEKLLKVYFPPQGPWSYASSAIKITIEQDGNAKLAKIVQRPLVHGKGSARADLCLRSAVENANPLEKPPKDMKLPTQFLVKFIVQAKGDRVFKCMAQRL